MSDVVVSTTEPVTTVTTVDDVVQVAVTNNVVEVSASTAGVQGASYAKGDPIYVTVRNATGATLAKGTIVYISGSNGNHVQVTPAIATSDATSARTLGWLADDIANNASGLCQVEGYLEGLNTQGLTSGSQLYLSGTVAGAFQVTKPQAPIHLVYVGVVTKISAGDGHVFVKVQNGYELDELHDVRITDPVNNQVLTYDSATDLWVNATNPADGVTSITAVSPLTGGTITSTGSIGLDQTALSITQSQVSNLVTDLAGKANLAGGNSLTGAQTITSTAIGEFPLSIIPASGQTASTFRVRNSANTGDLFSVDSSGNLRSPALINLSTFNNSRISMQNTGVLVDTQIATNVPISVRGASGQTANLMELQTSASALRHRFTDSGRMYSSFSGTFGSTSDNSGTLAVLATSASTIGQVIRGAASQSAHLLQVQDSSGTVLSGISASGRIYTGTAPLTNAGAQSANISALADAATVTPLIVRGAASQSADLFEVQNSSLVDLFSVSSAGLITAKVVGNAANQSRGLLLSNTADTWQSGLYLRSDASGFPRLSLLAPTGALGEAVSIDSAAKVGIGNVAPVAQLDVYSQSSTRVGQVIRGAASQTADLLQIQNSAGSVLSYFGSSGLLNIQNASIRVNTQNSSYGARIQLNTEGTGVIGQVIRATTGQTANLQEWQSDTGSIRARVDNTGNIFAPVLAGINSLVFLRELESGGLLEARKLNAAVANPGANSARLYFRDGTNAGTLKLVVRAGAAGAETTILDNIPQ